MLVLLRRPGECIRIGDHIKVIVRDVDRNRVTLGIEAPKDIPVNREEIHDAIQREREKASPTAAPKIDNP